MGLPGLGTLPGQGVEASPASEVEKEPESAWVSDTAKGEVYICFKGPLGAHLKQEVREKIRKGKYVEMNSLLPLEQFNLDRACRDENKEDEEWHWYLLIPHTFTNWLQAFAILASLIGARELFPHFLLSRRNRGSIQGVRGTGLAVLLQAV